MADKQTGKAPEASKSEAPKGEEKLYTVRGPGSISFGGEVHAPGKELMLDATQAESLGNSVFLGRAKPVDNIEKRRAGIYKVSEGHNVLHDGRFLPPGELIELTEAEARKLAQYVEPAA